MPSFNFTFQEASPLITYAGFWTEGSKHNDTRWADYDGSFRVTNSSGAKVTLDFNGTGVSFFGALRPNHGGYTVDLDHGISNSENGTGPDLYKQALWQSYGLSYGPHIIEATNQPSSSGPYFDLDYVQIERVIGQNTDTLFMSTFDDVSPSVQYNGNWVLSSSMENMNHNGTIHQTTENDSELEIAFQGCCVELYGLYTNAAYTVALDGGPPKTMQGMDIDLDTEFWHPQTLLYLVDGLREDQNHTISLITTKTDEKRPFSFDYGIVRSTQNLTSKTNPSSYGEPTGSSKTIPSSHGGPGGSSKTIPVSHIVGVAIGGMVLFALIIIVAFFLFFRRRIHRASFQADDMTQMGTESATDGHPNWTSWAPIQRARRPSSVISPWHPPSGDDHNLIRGLLDPQQQAIAGSALIPNGSIHASNILQEKHHQDITDPSSARGKQRAMEKLGLSVQSQTDLGVHRRTTNSNSLNPSQNIPHPSLASHRNTLPVSVAREEDAGTMHRDGTLPPAYDTVWDQR